MSADDDLDALLDEAMVIVDEKERQQKEDTQRRKKELDKSIEKALEEVDGGGDILQSFQHLLSGAASGGEIDENFFENFKKDVGKLLGSLEGVEDLSEEDQKNLDRVKELMSVMDSNDDARAQELLKEMEKEKTDLPADVSGEGFGDAMREYAETMKRLSETIEGAEKKEGGNGAAEPSALPSGENINQLEENMANMLLSTILDPSFIEPIKLMRASYEPYLEQNPNLDEDKKVLYMKQYQKTVEICEFLEVPVEKDDDARVAKLLELMHEFSELGEPPANLSEYSPNVEVTDKESTNES